MAGEKRKRGRPYGSYKYADSDLSHLQWMAGRIANRTRDGLYTLARKRADAEKIQSPWERERFIKRLVRRYKRERAELEHEARTQLYKKYQDKLARTDEHIAKISEEIENSSKDILKSYEDVERYSAPLSKKFDKLEAKIKKLAINSYIDTDTEGFPDDIEQQYQQFLANLPEEPIELMIFQHRKIK